MRSTHRFETTRRSQGRTPCGPTSSPSAERHSRRQRLLRHVLGLRLVAQHAPGDGQGARQVTVDERAERGRVAVWAAAATSVASSLASWSVTDVPCGPGTTLFVATASLDMAIEHFRFPL